MDLHQGGSEVRPSDTVRESSYDTLHFGRDLQNGKSLL